jgi:hypothetical protein
MESTKKRLMTRRDFVKTSAAGVAALSMGSLFEGNPAFAADPGPLNLKPEKDAVIRVLRWSLESSYGGFRRRGA